MTYDAILSYRHKDLALCNFVQKELERTLGLSVYRDRGDMIPGGEWTDQWRAAVEGSDQPVIVVIITANTVDPSDNMNLVQEETAIAWRLFKRQCEHDPLTALRILPILNDP